MAFKKQPAVVPVSIGEIFIEMYDPAPGEPVPGQESDPQRAFVTVQILLSDGQTLRRSFPLQDHVSAAVITQLQTLALDLRTKAQALLPTEVIA